MPILGPPISYPDLLEELTSIKINKEGQRKYNPLRPSNAGKCSRELAYELAEYRGMKSYQKAPNQPVGHRIFSFGYSTEYHVIKQFEEAFKEMENPVELKYKQQLLSFFKLADGSFLEGSIDGTFISKKYGTLFDIKSKKDKFSAAYKTDWDGTNDYLKNNAEQFGEGSYWIEDLDAFLSSLKDPFWANNFYQLNFYFFDQHSFLRERGIDHASLLYYNKNDSRLREIRFKPSQAVYDQVKDKFLMVDKVITETQDPTQVKQDYVLGSIKCAFCSFQNECWPETNQLKAYFETLPSKKWPKDTERMNNELANGFERAYSVFKDVIRSKELSESAEEDLCQMMNTAGISKIRFSDGAIYEMKKLKSGGIAGGPRMVLRKGKL